MDIGQIESFFRVLCCNALRLVSNFPVCLCNNDTEFGETSWARAVELQEKLKELNFTAYLLNNNSEAEFQRIGFIAVLIM